MSVQIVYYRKRGRMRRGLPANPVILHDFLATMPEKKTLLIARTNISFEYAKELIALSVRGGLCVLQGKYYCRTEKGDQYLRVFEELIKLMENEEN